MAHKQMQQPSIYLDGEVGMVLRREAHQGHRFGAIPVDRLQVLGKFRPAQGLEGADLAERDRIPGEDHHAILPGEEPVAQGIVAVVRRARVQVDDPVSVEVDAGVDAGVGRGHIPVAECERLGAVLRHREVVLGEGPCGEALGIPVELVEEDDVGSDALEGLCDGARLRVVPARQVSCELARAAAKHRGVEGGDPQRDRRRGRVCGGVEVRQVGSITALLCLGVCGDSGQRAGPRLGAGRAACECDERLNQRGHL